MASREIEVVNKLGLHARPAGKIVEVASSFGSTVELSLAGKSVNAKSIMGVMLLAASCGTKLQAVAEGEDAEAALDALQALFASRFGEAE